MRIGITGSRHLKHTQQNYEQLNRAFLECLLEINLTLEGISAIVHGGCKTGVDHMLHQLARDIYQVKTLVYEPKPDEFISFGRACQIRNERIVNETEYLFGFKLWGAQNKGTTNTIRIARSQSKKVITRTLRQY